jgi:DNA mismatch repair protein MutL
VTTAHVTEQEDGIIRVMPEPLANKIAAGEVVQRPASVVKELVENSVDAGADEISVIIKAAGAELIQIIDNGSGMGRGDAEACFRRHATSKIRSIEDLERICTLGFRGEALASIGAVAQVELKTRRVQDAAGTRVRVDGGHVTAVEPCATTPGTVISVRNLFFNVPARRNFLKTPATEFKHIVETCHFLALSHPEIGFTLINDGNEVFRLASGERGSGTAALRQRVAALFGHASEALIDVSETTSYVSIRGLIGRPATARRVRGEQFLFVNDRYVKSRYLEHAVISAFEGALSDEAYPFFALYLDIDPSHVDVNVHPTKAEVKFDDERGVYAMLHAVARRTVGAAHRAPPVDTGGTTMSFVLPDEVAMRSGGRVDQAEGPGFSRPGYRPAFESARPFEGFAPSYRPGDRGMAPGDLTESFYGGPAQLRNEAEAPQQGAPAEPSSPEEGPTDDRASLWQMQNGTIISQIKSGLLFVDPSAAHERILYEQAMRSFKGDAGLSQQLLFPETIDLDAADFALFQEILPDLRALGFEVEVFSGRSIALRGVPIVTRAGDERQVLEDLLSQLRQQRPGLKVKGREQLAKLVARRNALRPGTRLSVPEMRSLIDRLFGCEMPYASPGGRATMFKMPFDEIDQRFR